MRQTRDIMGMPITVEIVDSRGTFKDIQAVFDYFVYVDNTFSTFKPDSEISRINREEIDPPDFSSDMKQIFDLAEQTKEETNGFFNIWHDEKCDPSGLVKGWAIQNAADMLKNSGLTDFYIEAGGDVQTEGHYENGNSWRVGIRNPFNLSEIVKVLELSGEAIATSGTYERGAHIYNPHTDSREFDIVSLTVVGPNIYDADRYATAAFAMGKKGIEFIYTKIGFEGYMIDSNGRATFTPGFETYTIDGNPK